MPLSSEGSGLARWPGQAPATSRTGLVYTGTISTTL